MPNLIELLKTDNEKIRFSVVLIEEFEKYGYGTLSKNDLQDLIIHCLNGASNQDFLTDYSNYELARCLKTTDTKIKNMRMNITQKYDDSDSRKQLIKLFKRLIDGKTQVVYDKDREEINIGIENNVIKRELETAAKELGHTLDYRRNREIIIIDMDLFIDIVEYLNDEEQNVIYKGIIENESKLRKANKVQEVKVKVKENIGTITKDIIIGILTNVLQSS